MQLDCSNHSNKNDNFIENSDDNKTEITGRFLTRKYCKGKCTKKKIENQITDAKKSHYQKYPKSGVQNKH